MPGGDDAEGKRDGGGDDDDGPQPPKPKGKPKAPLDDFRLGAFRCLQCGAAFRTRTALDRHTEHGHSLQA